MAREKKSVAQWTFFSELYTIGILAFGGQSVSIKSILYTASKMLVYYSIQFTEKGPLDPDLTLKIFVIIYQTFTSLHYWNPNQNQLILLEETHCRQCRQRHCMAKQMFSPQILTVMYKFTSTDIVLRLNVASTVIMQQHKVMYINKTHL